MKPPWMHTKAFLKGQWVNSLTRRKITILISAWNEQARIIS